MTWPITRFVSPPQLVCLFFFVLPVDVRLLFGRSPDDDKANNFFGWVSALIRGKETEKSKTAKKKNTKLTKHITCSRCFV
jgi:hypothetical protein